MRYHLSLSIQQSTHSFLRRPSIRITHHRDRRPRPTDHPDTPTTGLHPFPPPLRQVPIHSSSATSPTSTALGPFRIASLGRLYRTIFASLSLPPYRLFISPSSESRSQLRSPSPLSPVSHPQVPIAIGGIHRVFNIYRHIPHPYTRHHTNFRRFRINCRMSVRPSRHPTALSTRFS